VAGPNTPRIFHFSMSPEGWSQRGWSGVKPHSGPKDPHKKSRL